LTPSPEGGAGAGEEASEKEAGEKEAGEKEAGEEAGPSVTVLFFAAAREAAGTRKARLPAGGRTLAELLDELRSTYGDELTAVLAVCAVWVNGSPVAGTTVLAGGDEVAVLPPVSGGCGTLDFDVSQRRRSL
jgi:molybdopterin converting factor subunit 1